MSKQQKLKKHPPIQTQQLIKLLQRRRQPRYRNPIQIWSFTRVMDSRDITEQGVRDIQKERAIRPATRAAKMVFPEVVGKSMAAARREQALGFFSLAGEK